MNELLFGAGTLELSEPSFGTLAGTLGGPGWSLALSGPISYGNPFTVRFQGASDINGETWVYDYTGYLVPPWPNGVDLQHVDVAAAAPGSYDCVVIVNDHSAFDYAALQLVGKFIVDTRNAIANPGSHVRRLGAPRAVAVEPAFV